MSFNLEKLYKKILIADGSMGALLQSRGLPAGYSPALWNIENQDQIFKVHREYVDAGADIILTNTFGANRLVLADYNASSKVKRINEAAVMIARKAASEKGAYVAGNIGPLGAILEPVGDLKFDDALACFHEQCKVLLEAKVDLIMIETMFDLLEMKAAVIAANELRGSIPLIASMTFNEDGMTDTGVSAEVAASVLTGLDVDIVGVNCSTGPESMINVVKRFAKTSARFIAAKPNAGLPENKDGELSYKMSMDKLASFGKEFVNSGVNILGGCCGSTPDYIKMLKQSLSTEAPLVRDRSRSFNFTSTRIIKFAGSSYPFLKIGEKINPTGKKKFSEAIKNGDLSLVVKEAKREEENGADALDLNVGVPLIDEALMMKRSVAALLNVTSLPLVIDSSSKDAIEAGLKVYPGKALINSINGEESKIAEIAPIAKKYGASIIALLSDDNIPESHKERVKVAEKILKALADYKISEDKVIFDVLALVVSAMQYGSKETLDTIKVISKDLGFPTIAGISNVSFGLPERKLINRTFLSMAIGAGLDAAIIDPYDTDLKNTISTAEIFTAKDQGCSRYISHALSLSSDKASLTTFKDEILSVNLSLKDRIYNAILEGDRENIKDLINLALKEDINPLDLFANTMTPAIRELGDLFAKRVKFIPHLVASAETMKIGMKILDQSLSLDKKKDIVNKGTVVFATVKGDIHDIGKNICIVMLENFGFKVIDMGKNVDSDLILDVAKKNSADIIALSALMTTTMKEMKIVIDKLKERNLCCKVAVGGAVVTQSFADSIGADRYVKDVGGIVRAFESMVGVVNG